MRQGDVCYHTFKEPDKRRPVLVLTRNSAIPRFELISIAPITTTMRNIPTEVFLDENDGLAENCAVNLDNIQTVPKSKLGKVTAHLSPERMREVKAAIEFAFDFKKL